MSDKDIDLDRPRESKVVGYKPKRLKKSCGGESSAAKEKKRAAGAKPVID